MRMNIRPWLKLGASLAMGGVLLFFVGSLISLFGFLKILVQTPSHSDSREEIRAELRREAQSAPQSPSRPPPLTDALTRVVNSQIVQASPIPEAQEVETPSADATPAAPADPAAPLLEAQRIIGLGHVFFQNGASIRETRQAILDAAVALQNYSMEKNQGVNRNQEEMRALVSMVLESEDPSSEDQGEIADAYRIFLTTMTDPKTTAERTKGFLEHQKDPNTQKTILKLLFQSHPEMKRSL